MRIITAQEIYRAYYYDRIKADKKYVSFDELPKEIKDKLLIKGSEKK